MRRKRLNEKSFGGRAFGSSTFHVSPFTILESKARTLYGMQKASPVRTVEDGRALPARRF